MSNKNWQVQKQLRTHTGHDGDSTPEWRDIVTVSNSDKYGPGTKAQALESLQELRETYTHAVYRIVKVSPL